MQNILDAILPGNAETGDDANLDLPEHFRAMAVHEDEVEMFEGVPSKDEDPRTSLHVVDVALPELGPDEAFVAATGVRAAMDPDIQVPAEGAISVLLQIDLGDSGNPVVQVRSYDPGAQLRAGSAGERAAARHLTDGPEVPRVAGVEVWLTEELTPRECQVAALAAHGLTNSEIGDALSLSSTTVKFHLQNVMRKTGLRNRVGIAAWAWQTGLDRHADHHIAIRRGPAAPGISRGGRRPAW